MTIVNFMFNSMSSQICVHISSDMVYKIPTALPVKLGEYAVFLDVRLWDANDEIKPLTAVFMYV